MKQPLEDIAFKIKARIASASSMEVIVFRTSHGIGCCTSSSAKAARIWDGETNEIMGTYDELATVPQLIDDLKAFLTDRLCYRKTV